VDGPRLQALIDGYGLDEKQRRQLPGLIGATTGVVSWRSCSHTRAMYDLLHRSSATGAQPWARLYAEGHAGPWQPRTTSTTTTTGGSTRCWSDRTRSPSRCQPAMSRRYP